MLACRLDVEVRFNISLTILSAFVAVVFTFVALASPYASEAIENSTPIRALSKWNSEIRAGTSRFLSGRRSNDLEAGYVPLPTASDPEDRASLALASEANDDDDLGGSSDEEEADGAVPSDRPHTSASTSGSGPSRLPEGQRRPSFSISDNPHRTGGSPARSPRHRLLQRALASNTRASTPSSSSTTTSSTEESSFMRNLSGTTLATSSTSSWGEPLRAGLSREARLRIKARAKERPPPVFDWRYWAKMHYQSVTVFLFIRAVIWALAIVFMHYCGTYRITPLVNWRN